MEIKSAQFGPIEFDEHDILTFREGLIGFESCRRWVLVPDPGTRLIAWLQSVERPDLALAVGSPQRLAPDQVFHIARQELAPLGIEAAHDAELLVILSKTDDGLAVDLKAPLVVNLQRAVGRQVIANGSLPVARVFFPGLLAVRRSA